MMGAGYDPDDGREDAAALLLDAIGEAVGGLMEAIDLPKLGITMYVNESGLVGDVALVGLTDDEGEDTSSPLVFEEMVVGTHLLRVESRYADNTSWSWNDEIYDNYWEALRQAITSN